MTTICLHQPIFFPYLGVFHKIRESDIFVLMDDDQYSKNNWFNRNRIKTILKSEAKWFTIPIAKSQSFKPINEVQVSKKSSWKSKHLNMFRENYRGANFFSEVFDIINQVYDLQSTKLIDYNIKSIELVLEYLCIDTPIVKISELDLPETNNPTERIINVCQSLKATTYLSGSFGVHYLEEEKFTNLKLRYHEFVSHQYDQLGEGFVSDLSIIDYMFNIGSKFS